jgi:hypothetical protein
VQDPLNQPLLRGKSMTPAQYRNRGIEKKNHEFILFGDNTLECLTLLNPLVDPSTPLKFVGLVHLPLDQPIYVFQLDDETDISVKVCGSYSNWALPQPVAELINRYDLPDFVLFNAEAQEVVFAGELTETASVGNSQWQRELRKIAAAELGVPFIYQTAYSGIDTSQNSLREPTSALVYNALIYSMRYRTVSQVLFVEPNVEASQTRTRAKPLDSSAISTLLAGHLIESSTGDNRLRTSQENKIFQKMLDYLGESKYSTRQSSASGPRLGKDLPIVPLEVSNAILTQSQTFIEDLSTFLNGRDIASLGDKPIGQLVDFDSSKLVPWTDKRSALHISELFSYLDSIESVPARAPLAKFGAGIVDTQNLLDFLENSFSGETQALISKLAKYDETVVVPVVLHKKRYGEFQYVKDPYAGNTAAFCELLGFNLDGTRLRGILTYCVAENPENFDFHAKKSTNLYKSIAKYADGLVIDGQTVISSFQPSEKTFDNNLLSSLLDAQPLQLTEDTSLTSTYLQLSASAGSWRVSMIAIHHSSWQQISIKTDSGSIVQGTIGRNDSKVDLVMQGNNRTFLTAEGKRSFNQFFSTPQEKTKIRQAFENIKSTIEFLLKTSDFKQIVSLTCLLEVPETNSEFFLEFERRKIAEASQNGIISEIAGDEFVVIGVYVQDNETKFELFFSNSFDEDLMKLLQSEFQA